MSRGVSNIYNQGPSEAPQGSEVTRRNMQERRRLWHQLGVAVIDPNDINNDWERQQVINQAEALYGKRKVQRT